MVVLMSKKEGKKEKERRKENGKEGGKRDRKRRMKKEGSVIVRLTACLRMFVIWISLLNSQCR